jgi:branched-chain amino acid aminotransferase
VDGTGADAPDGCIWVNGEFHAPAQAAVPVLDFGFAYGDGVFETVRTYGGVPFRLDAHLARLTASTQYLGYRNVPDPAALAGIVAETIGRSGLAEATVRLTVTRGVGAGVPDPTRCGPATVVVAVLPLRTVDAALRTDGVDTVTLWQRPTAPPPGPGMKSTSWQYAVLARAELAARTDASGRRPYEGFWLDGDHVTEGSVSNVFAVAGTVVRTPPADVCLPGVTRAEVFDLAVEVGVDVCEEPLDIAALQGADEVFVTNASVGVLGVARVDGVAVGSGRGGPVTDALHTAYLGRAVPS